MIRALIFDFDGLILDTETPIVDAWVALHEEAGLACARDDALRLVGTADVAFDPWTAFPPTHDRAELHRRYRQRYRDAWLAQPLQPGVAALLDAARCRGLHVGLASNSDHAHVEGHLSRLGLLTRFEVIRCRDDVRAGKPAPDVYLAACAALGVRPAEAIAFEDSVPGHQAARRAGLHCVVVPNGCTAHCTFPDAHLQLGSLAETTLDELCARLGTGDLQNNSRCCQA